jgi:hypothetical protein
MILSSKFQPYSNIRPLFGGPPIASPPKGDASKSTPPKRPEPKSAAYQKLLKEHKALQVRLAKLEQEQRGRSRFDFGLLSGDGAALANSMRLKAIAKEIKEIVSEMNTKAAQLAAMRALENPSKT